MQAERRRLGKQPIKNLNRMVAKLKGKFMPSDYQQTIFRHMHNLRQRSMIVKEYIEEFYKVSIRVGEIQDIDEKVARYVNALIIDIQDEISALSPKIVEEVYQMVLKVEEKLMRKQSTRNRGTPQGNAIVAQTEAEATTVTEEENIQERRESLVANKVLLKLAKEVVEPAQRKALFRTMCKVHGKCCQMIIDSGSTDNLVSIEVVEKLKLKARKHPTPYKVLWLEK
eukprot:PITA_23021